MIALYDQPMNELDHRCSKMARRAQQSVHVSKTYTEAPNQIGRGLFDSQAAIQFIRRLLRDS